MNKHTDILRWFSLIPVTFTILVLSDWIVRIALWFIRLPIILFEKAFGFGSGPIGKLMDGITNFLVGLDSTETLTVVATGLLTGAAAVYALSIVAPTNKKATAKILTAVYLAFLALGLVAFIVNGVTGQNILWVIALVTGILLAWHSIKNETEKETEKYEKIIQENAKRIFVSTFLFAVLLTAFFLFI